jgi:Gas vesicle protein
MTGYPYPTDRYLPAPYREPSNLGDVLERVLDKGIVIAGDITIDLLKIELLTIKLRLLIASADKAREMGIDWWASDPFLSGRAGDLSDENRALKERIDRLERVLEAVSTASDRGEDLSDAYTETESRSGEAHHGPPAGRGDDTERG